MQAEVSAIRHTLTARDAAGWWLAVTWRFRNPGDRPVYLLSAGPLWILEGDPLILNHAVEDAPVALDRNAEPDMEFATIDAAGSLDMERRYPLPSLELRMGRDVVGRFALGTDRPDPSWRQGLIWDAVRRWQQVVQSAAFRIGGAGASAVRPGP